MGAASSDLRGLAADQIIALIGEYFQSRNMTLSQAFNFLDRDGSHEITWDEFRTGIEICLENTGSYRIGNDEIYRIFKRFDRNHDDRISVDEFEAQYYNSRRGSSGRNWYEDDLRLRNGGHAGGVYGSQGTYAGQGPRVLSTDAMQERRADDVICRIAAAIGRTGFTPMQLFQKVDLDHNGRLSWSELERVIVSFQPDLSATERQQIFRRFDKDGNGGVDVNEFCNTLNGFNPNAFTSMETKVKALGDKFRAQGQTVSEAFHVFDVNWDGYLTRDEWFRAMRTFNSYGTNMNDTEIDAIFSRFDVNGDGYMSIAEFDQFFRDAIDRSVGAGGVAVSAPAYGALPNYPTYPVEQPWETEVLELVRSCLSVGRSGMQITDVFRRLDIDSNGSMTPVEFQRMVSAYRPDLTAAHMDSLFLKVNHSNTGAITLSEFVRRFG